MTSTEHQSPSNLRGPDAPEWARLEDLSRTRLLDTPSEERFDRITRLAQNLFGVSAASVSLIAENRQYLKSFVGTLSRDSDRRDAFCAETIKSAETMIVENARTDERFRDSPLVTGNPHIMFYAGRPLTGPGGTHVGTFCIVDQSPRSFDAEQQKILEDLTQIIQREMNLSWDIDYGARTQRAMLPLTPPAPAGYSLATCFYPAFGLSGDFYDLGTTGSGHFRITVGDAMGKGVGPGLVAGAAHSAFVNTGWDADPASILRYVSDRLDETLTRAGSYATVFHAEIDPATGSGLYSDAGQGLTHILRADNTMERLPPTGPPLGLVPGGTWDQRPFTLSPGEAILIPTDGLLDLHGGDLSRLAAAMPDCRTADDPDTTLKKLCDRRGKVVVLDDITAVLFRRAPEEP
ncbi:PP2C family protein-serine/threonine phosphatase [Arthrobacter sp. SO3]|uniref:PP2C family protein-serine/threonine phosphatase n=1 Tax=Arthrobacter sp. SO3 TaxID=1897057 RepID=UPI001CFF8CC5|nr:SpoIIE family protein phosphatase [Arthrobacter sp. SO3]MCB5290748.1 Phosphoserine phosphatase RsbP [Arthrobacter sp. SO3]